MKKQKPSSEAQARADQQERDRELLLALLLLYFWPVAVEMRKRLDAGENPTAVLHALQAYIIESIASSKKQARARVIGDIHELTGNVVDPKYLEAPQGQAIADREQAKEYFDVLNAHLKNNNYDEKVMEPVVGPDPYVTESVISSAIHVAYVDEVQRLNNELGYVVAYQYVTMRDDRVRPRHREQEGKIIKYDDVDMLAYWGELLNDWNCRCQVIALYSRPASDN